MTYLEKGKCVFLRVLRYGGSFYLVLSVRQSLEFSEKSFLVGLAQKGETSGSRVLLAIGGFYNF